jgi:hypothetical protein
MPSDEWNAGFAAGEADRLAQKERRDLAGKSDDFKEGYESGYTGTGTIG